MSTLFDEDAEYQAFVEKFKPKKTTDDCYTPEPVYEAVRDYVCARYGVDPGLIVRRLNGRRLNGRRLRSSNFPNASGKPSA